MRVFISTFLIIISVYCYAQDDSTYLFIDTIAPIQISGFKTKLTEDKYLSLNANSLQDYVSLQSSFHIKNRGPSALKTITARGSNASQTKVTWQGLPINSATNGTVDFTTIPLSDVQSIELAESDLNQIGGTVRLNTNSPSTNGVSFSLTNSSFNNSNLQYSLNIKHKKIATSTSLSVDNNQNNITIVNELLPRAPEQEVTHARLTRRNIQQSVWYTGSKFNVDLHGWYSLTDRELPRGLFGGSASAEQLDENIRIAANAQIKTTPKLTLNSQSGFLSEYLLFEDPRIATFSQTNAYQYLQTFSTNLYPIENLKIKPSFYTNLNVVNSENHGGRQSRLHSKTGILTNYYNSYLSSELDFVQNILAGEFLSPSFAGKVKIPIKHGVSLSLLGSINTYNVPNLNDNFWIGVGGRGNQDILPERAQVFEASIAQKKKIKSIDYVIETSFFNKWVTDWILWQPTDFNSGIWSPENVNQVRVEGIDTKATLNIKANKHLSFHINGSYTGQTVIQQNTINEANEGKQLFYTPQHIGTALIGVQYNTWRITGNGVFTGERFTNNDNTNSLEAYQLYAASINKVFSFKGNSMEASFKVDNLLDTFYLNFENSVPLPRNFILTIKLNIK